MKPSSLKVQKWAIAQDEWPLLVVVPASLRLAWAEELARWLPHLRPSAVHLIEGRTDRLDGSTAPPVRAHRSVPTSLQIRALRLGVRISGLRGS